MTKEIRSAQTKYLASTDVRDIYNALEQRFKEIGEPIQPYRLVNKNEIQTLVTLPQTAFYGIDQYPTLESKAAILFYKINKGHIFPNGNKRLSIACLLMFLQMNGLDIALPDDDITNKAIWLAQTQAEDFDAVKKQLEEWIADNAVDFWGL